MGMQIHFSLNQFDESCNVQVIKELINDDGADNVEYTYTAVINCNNGTSIESFDYIPPSHEQQMEGATLHEDGTCWFDCDSASDSQMALIEWLIRNRICFQAS